MSRVYDKCSGKELAEFIRHLGVIFDLYIARKRDKGGNRFGFVSFLDVKDTKEMVRNLCDIRMGDYGLRANVARFTLEDGEIGPQSKEHRKPVYRVRAEEKSEELRSDSNTFMQGGRSFQEILTGKRSGEKEMRVVRVEDRIEAYQNTHGRALIMRMMDWDALKRFNSILEKISPEVGKVQYLGGLSVMVTFEYKESAEVVYKAAKEVIGRFSSVSYWEGQALAYERLAWLKVQGLPVQLLTSEVIDKVGEGFGKIIHRPPRSEGDSDLSYDYIGVLVGEGRKISEEVMIQWRDRRFRIWVSEEAGDWVPDFFEDKEDDLNVEEEVSGSTSQINVVDNLNVKGTNEPVAGSGDGVSPTTGSDGPSVMDPIMEDINVSLNGDINKEGGNEEEFIPGINFDFEKEIQDNNLGDIYSNVNKRKKKQLTNGCVGQPNLEYSSSIEKTKMGKKPKGVGQWAMEDLGDNNENGEGLNCNLVDKEDHEINIELSNNFTTLNNVYTDDVNDANNFEENCAKNVEVEETIRMGILLGAQLQDHRQLVQEAITVEGVQVVDK
ncbi:putative RNA-binding domain superfamily [Helianthus annuus]|nr:putative RNA-binding domain superfamily [Helianthus annuus]